MCVCEGSAVTQAGLQKMILRNYFISPHKITAVFVFVPSGWMTEKSGLLSDMKDVSKSWNILKKHEVLLKQKHKEKIGCCVCVVLDDCSNQSRCCSCSVLVCMLRKTMSGISV